MDATLRELATLVKEVNPDARRKGTYIDFNVVFPNIHQGKYVNRDIGSICVGELLLCIPIMCGIYSASYFRSD